MEVDLEPQEPDAYADAEVLGSASLHGDDGFMSESTVTSAGFAQRLKALATTGPLHDLDARKAQVLTADYAVYQMAELALRAGPGHHRDGL